MIDGVFIGFYIPPAIVILIAAYFLVTRLYRGDTIGALKATSKAIVIGLICCAALFGACAMFYYSNGGH